MKESLCGLLSGEDQWYIEIINILGYLWNIFISRLGHI